LRNSTDTGDARVYLAREAREVLAKLNPARREALSVGLRNVGRQLLASAERVAVEPGWASHTWPLRRYPQQCYSKTTKYVLDHPQIKGMQLVHGVISHAPHFVPLDHAWVELPGDVVFDGVVQAFFTRESYYAVMAAVPLDTYTGPETRRLMDAHGHPGPWNASWVPTAAQLDAYAEAVGRRQEARAALASSVNVARTDSRAQAQWR
jgi:hypothetical protein